ncbi:MAG: phage tail protein [Propionibacteriaceae bacterium]|jgi:hypothetical protein|nr:phage tail protein [Propionibacteriaceae bacterium]
MSRRFIVRLQPSEHILFDSWDADPNHTLIGQQVNEQLNAAPGYQFMIAITHPYISEVVESATIEILDTARPDAAFYGHILSIDRTHTAQWTVNTQGAALLLGTIEMHPYDYAGTIDGYIQSLLDVYNAAQSDPAKQILLGQVSVTDPNDYIVRSSETYTDGGIWKHMLDRLPNSALGGYLYVRYDAGQLYLDYLTQSGALSTQRLEFGRNIVDYKASSSIADQYTVIRPLGAQDEKTTEIDPVSENRINIAGEPATGNHPAGALYAYDPAKVAALGWREKTIRYDDITIPAHLVDRALNALAATGARQISVTATPIDLCDTGDTDTPLLLGQWIQATAPDFNGILQVCSIAWSPARADAKTWQLGTTDTSLINLNNSTIKRTADQINAQVRANYALNQRVTSTVAELYSSIEQTSDEILMEVGSTYATQDALSSTAEGLESEIGIAASGVQATFDSWVSQTYTDEMGRQVSKWDALDLWLRASVSGVDIGRSQSQYATHIDDDEFHITQSGLEVFAARGNQVQVGALLARDSVQVGRWQWRAVSVSGGETFGLVWAG